MPIKSIIKLWSLVLSFIFACNPAYAQTTAFTYQGKLSDGGTAANGQYDFSFKLFSAASGGSQVGSEVARGDVQVTGGLFTVNLDFGASPFASSTGNFLEIGVRPGPSTGAYTLLTPRLQIANTPYSIKSANADNAANATNATNAANATLATNALQLGGVAANQFVQTTDSRLSDARNPLPNSSNYIQNTTSLQSSGNFNISGNGTVGGALTGNIVTAATQFNLGIDRILSAPGSENLFAGGDAGAALTTGIENSLFGKYAGSFNNTGTGNSYFGFAAGRFTSTGSYNSVFGNRAALFNEFGNFNAFFGHRAGENNKGDVNSFFGTGSGLGTSFGNGNTFIGHDAGKSNAAGSFNTILGESADFGNNSLTNATAIGSKAYVTQSDSLVLGSINGTNSATADTKVGIGTTAPAFRLEVVDPANAGLRVQTNTTGGAVASFGGNGAFQIDAAGIAGGRLNILENGSVGLGVLAPATRLDVGGILTIRVLGSAGSTSLCLNPSFQVGSCSSSIRYKSNINSFDPGLSLIKRLRPVSFNWKADGQADFGLVAEEVAGVEPLLVTRNPSGEIEGVKYDRVGVVLVNAVNQQQAEIEAQQKRIDDQAGIIQKQAEKIERQQSEIERQRSELEALKALVCSNNRAARICEPKN